MTIIQYLFFLLFLVYSSFVFPTRQQDHEHNRPIITIWVHGTRQLFSKYFFKKFFSCPAGLHCISDIDKESHVYSMATGLHKQSPEEFPLGSFYSFGWSGILSAQERSKAAYALCQELQKLLEHQKEPESKPFIRIITHSHGGNVALCMTQYKKEFQITIDELILLACPVQTITADYCKDPMFKQIYSLYSEYDSLQILDPQGLHYWYSYWQEPNTRNSLQKPASFFSARRFPDHSSLRQTAVKVNNRSLMHVEFIFQKFAQLLPNILHIMRSWKDHCPKTLLVHT